VRLFFRLQVKNQHSPDRRPKGRGFEDAVESHFRCIWRSECAVNPQVASYLIILTKPNSAGMIFSKTILLQLWGDAGSWQSSGLGPTPNLQSEAVFSMILACGQY
jgi:hypothetical protein